jgi:FAD/FMN-containing dehydrogenase
MSKVEQRIPGFSSTVLAPGDEGYDDARRVHNGLIDKRPSLIARCRTTADVAAAVNFGRDQGLEISVRGGGHNAAGRAVTDGGLMIDLAEMKEVVVDPDAKTITAQGGVTWAELNDAAHEHGLATTGGLISTTGIAGLTLGAGIGWTQAKFGMSIDNLISAEVVLATGEVVTASEDADPDLFWAIRGGGGNFGVVTSFTYRAHALETILGGIMAHPLPAAADVFRAVREFNESVSDELTVFLGLVHAPDGSGMKIVAVPVCHIGEDHAKADADIKPLRDLGPVLDMVDRIPYPVINTLVDGAFPAGKLNYWKSAFFEELSDEAVATMQKAFENTPTIECAFFIEHFHGAATRISPTDTAFPNRQRGYNFVLIAQWEDPAQTDECIAWARETFDSLRPFMADRVYVNYLDSDEKERIRSAYGPNYERLVELKRRYDPENLFRLNQNIAP